MAKILTGPLAAAISGKLGPVVFRYDRFGQIVYSKAKTHVHKTAPAIATKNRFRECSRLWSRLHPWGTHQWAHYAALDRRADHGPLFSSMLRDLAGKGWVSPRAGDLPYTVRIVVVHKYSFALALRMEVDSPPAGHLGILTMCSVADSPGDAIINSYQPFNTTFFVGINGPANYPVWLFAYGREYVYPFPQYPDNQTLWTAARLTYP